MAVCVLLNPTLRAIGSQNEKDALALAGFDVTGINPQTSDVEVTLSNLRDPNGLYAALLVNYPLMTQFFDYARQQYFTRDIDGNMMSNLHHLEAEDHRTNNDLEIRNSSSKIVFRFL